MTPRQLAAAQAIQKFIKENGHSPSIRELGGLLGCGATTAHWLVKQLRERRIVRSLPGHFRALALTQRIPDGPGVDCVDLVDHLRRQQEFSRRTFGPGRNTAALLDHIRKELVEIEAAPTDLIEWIDVVLLALDGAWRAGWSPEEIAAALEAKQALNETRKWPDWRTAEPGRAIQHVE
jgi:SOS-response transcriptional repressor LexA